MLTSQKTEARRRRHHRLRMHLRGTTERPRLAVFRSLNHIYAQIIDDTAGHTLVTADSRSPDFRQRGTSGGNVSGAKAVGELLAERAKARGITQVIFDRGGHKYHGRVKALAEAARAGGLKF